MSLNRIYICNHCFDAGKRTPLKYHPPEYKLAEHNDWFIKTTGFCGVESKPAETPKPGYWSCPECQHITTPIG